MNTKIAYQTDRAGMYLGTVDADESPLEPGVFLMPARCVEIAPPDTWLDAQWPRWNGVAWDLVTNPAISAPPVDAAAKLRTFLQSNPDVAELIGM